MAPPIFHAALLTWDGLNALSENQATLNTDTTGWAASANCSISRSTTKAADGLASLRLSSTGAGDMSATTPTGLLGESIVAGLLVSAGFSVITGASARSVRAKLTWYDSTGAVISTSTGASVNDRATGWACGLVSASAPVGALYVALVVEVLATGGAAELHYFDRIWLSVNLPASRGGLRVAGQIGNWATVPDAAALHITGDIDIRVRVALDDWTPGALQVIAGKWKVSGQLCWLFYLDTVGKLNFAWTPDGTNPGTKTSTVATGIADLSTAWVRVTFDVNNGAAGNDAKFYTSTDDTDDDAAVTWAQLGATVTNGFVTSIFAGTSPVTVGDAAVSSLPLAGLVRSFAICSGIGGSRILSGHFTNVAGDVTTWMSSEGFAWTIAGEAYLDRWEAGAGDLFVRWELERSDATTLNTFQTIASITSQFVAAFYDWEALLGGAESYRLRWLRSDGAYSEYSIVSQIVIAAECCHVDFTTNEGSPANFVQVDQLGKFEFELPDQKEKKVYELFGVDGAASFTPSENRGDRFKLHAMVAGPQNLPAMPGRQAFSKLTALARSSLSYICVRDTDGNRWFAELTVAKLTVQRFVNSGVYTADIDVAEITFTSSTPDAAP